VAGNPNRIYKNSSSGAQAQKCALRTFSFRIKLPNLKHFKYVRTFKTFYYIMASLGMKGSFPLTKEEIDKQIPEKVIGNYAYGHSKVNSEGREVFHVDYVGRADEEPLRERIKHGINEGYKEFKFSTATNVKDAFEKECQNWHDFGGPDGQLDNKIHPDKPNGTDYKCPICEKIEQQKRQLKLERPRFRR
jgi:hypothetical protein